MTGKKLIVRRRRLQKYVCLPIYQCACNGKPTSYSSMIRHRNAARMRFCNGNDYTMVTDAPVVEDAAIVVKEFELRDICGDIATNSHVAASSQQFSDSNENTETCQIGSYNDQRITRNEISPVQSVVQHFNTINESEINHNLDDTIQTSIGDAASRDALHKIIISDQEDISNLSSSFSSPTYNTLHNSNSAVLAMSTIDESIHQTESESNSSSGIGNELLHYVTAGKSNDDSIQDGIFSSDDERIHQNDNQNFDFDYEEETECGHVTMEVENLMEVDESDNNANIMNWIQENKKWVDLHYKKGLSETAMEEIFKCINIQGLTWRKVQNLIIVKSGLLSTVQTFFICPGHMCFAPVDGILPSKCSECNRPNLEKTNNTPNGDYFIKYLPIFPRIVSMLQNEASYKLLYSYLENSSTPDGMVSEFSDCSSYRRIASLYGGRDNISNDIFISISTDGFEPYKNNSHSVWPIIATVLNLPSDYRYLIRNILPISFVPGPRQPTNLQSFLLPVVNEINHINRNGGTSVTCIDKEIRKVRIHLLYFTGDLPAIQKVAGVVGHNGVSPCRFCNIRGIYCRETATGRGGHYYYPSKIRRDDSVSTVYNASSLPIRSILETFNTIETLKGNLSNAERIQVQKNSGIKGDCVLLNLSSIVPYTSFPIDIMHLIINVGKDIISLWVNQTNQRYNLPKQFIKQIDKSLQAFSAGVSSQLGDRPKLLANYREWKAIDLKNFILRYSLVVLDKYMAKEQLQGWHKFVQLMDLCHRPCLTTTNINQIRQLSQKFFKHFENFYYEYDPLKVKLCKYMMHLILHLPENIEENGPLCNYSQYTAERYIGWMSSRLHARNRPAPSFFRLCMFMQAYQIYFKQPVHKSLEHHLLDTLSSKNNFKCLGGSCTISSTTRSPRWKHISRYFRNYLIRKYSGISDNQLNVIFKSNILCTIRSTAQFISNGIIQSFGSHLKTSSFSLPNNRSRQNCYVACHSKTNNELTCTIRYGRVKKIFEISLEIDYSSIWDHWQNTYCLVFIDWANHLFLGDELQIYTTSRIANSFQSPSLEDIDVVNRLISTVEHCVPTRNSVNVHGFIEGRSLKTRTYFIDDRNRCDELLSPTKRSADGSNYILHGTER